MQDLLGILNKTADYFSRRGLDQPRLQAEQLLAGALGLRRLDLYLQFERPLSNLELDRLRPLVSRRADGEPLQYILGEGHCGDFTVRVDRRVLIPRPETEELVHRLVKERVPPPATVLDLGTGSGVIALALAREWPEAQIVATDVDAGCLELAAENVAALGLGSRIQLRQGSWWEAVEGRFDLIVSNPPYLTPQEWQSAAVEVRCHEPRSALVGGESGLEDLVRIVSGAPERLNPDGTLALETGIGQHAELTRIATASGFKWSAGYSDMQGRPRFFMAGLTGEISG